MRIAILGAGALGTTAAHRLSAAGHAVTVVERSETVGGLASSFEIEPGMRLERFYHHLFASDHRAISLIREVGLEQDLLWSRPRTVTFLDSEYRQLDSATSLLRFAGLSRPARARMGLALAALRSLPRPVLMHDVRASDWLAGAMGLEGYGRVWEPLLQGKFGEHADAVVLAWFWARVHDRTARLGYLRGGFHRLYAALMEQAVARGTHLELGVEVDQVREAAGGLTLTTGAQATGETYDAILSTLPSAISFQIAPQLPAAFRERYQPPAAMSAQCLVLALDRPLVPAYWVNVNDPGFPFVTVVQHTDLVGTHDYGGRVLVYVGRYCQPEDPYLDLTASELLAAFEPSLRRLQPAFRASWVAESWSFSAPFAQPIVTAGYRRRIPPLTTPLRGFYLANMFQVYPHDRGQDRSILLAEQAAARLINAGAVTGRPRRVSRASGDADAAATW